MCIRQNLRSSFIRRSDRSFRALDHTFGTSALRTAPRNRATIECIDARDDTGKRSRAICGEDSELGTARSTRPGCRSSLFRRPSVGCEVAGESGSANCDRARARRRSHCWRVVGDYYYSVTDSSQERDWSSKTRAPRTSLMIGSTTRCGLKVQNIAYGLAPKASRG